MKHYFKVAEFKCCVNCEVQSLNERLGIVVSSFPIIEEVETENADAVIYDLAGRRIEKITQAGIYIVNGNKVLVK